MHLFSKAVGMTDVKFLLCALRLQSNVQQGFA